MRAAAGDRDVQLARAPVEHVARAAQLGEQLGIALVLDVSISIMLCVISGFTSPRALRAGGNRSSAPGARSKSRVLTSFSSSSTPSDSAAEVVNSAQASLAFIAGAQSRAPGSPSPARISA